ncbi:zinc ABC transporter substrate-binding protein [Geitlerinema sp. CS-897]|nr:zinc ABC transporter substrate-binding protein [Geitlerinema sp. CS-897]
MRVSLPTAVVSLGLSAIVGCSNIPTSNDTTPENSPENSPDTTLDITVSIVPQEYFVEKIGGDNVNVNVMVQPGASPATYEPRPEQLRALNEAEAYISIGVPYERAWMERIRSANSEMLVVDSTQGIDKMEMAAHHHEDEHQHQHQHEDADEHQHQHEDAQDGETLDPHVWLSPTLVKIQARNIHDALTQLDPENRAEYDTNFANFLEELDKLDTQIRDNLAGLENRKFIVFHPSWGYFARDYDLEQVPIEVGGQEPSAAELAELVSEAQAENIKIVFTQPEFNTQSAELIAREIDGEVIPITPLARDWSDNLLEVSQIFSEVLGTD